MISLKGRFNVHIVLLSILELAQVQAVIALQEAPFSTTTSLMVPDNRCTAAMTDGHVACCLRLHHCGPGRLQFGLHLRARSFHCICVRIDRGLDGDATIVIICDRKRRGQTDAPGTECAHHTRMELGMCCDDGTFMCIDRSADAGKLRRGQ